MRDAIADLVRDGDTVAIEGFTHLICFAAGHEIIRQRRRDLTLARMTPDVIYDQMIARRRRPQAGLLVAGQPGRRRACTPSGGGSSRPRWARGPPLELEEYSHFGMVGALHRRRREPALLPAALVLRDRPAGGQPADPADPARPYSDEVVYAVPPLNPDVAIIHAQRADAAGNTQVWGLLGCQKEAAFAADRVIVVVEELVDEAVIRADPNRTIIPGLIVDAVVVEPVRRPPLLRPGLLRPRQPLLPGLGRRSAATRTRSQAWLHECVHGVTDRAAYMEQLGAERLATASSPGSAPVRLRRLRELRVTRRPAPSAAPR